MKIRPALFTKNIGNTLMAIACSPKSKDYFFLFVGTGLGLGLSPIMPGTCGALLGVFLHILISTYLPPSAYLISLIFVFLATCYANNILYLWAKTYWQDDDPKHFILDEIAGYLLVPILFQSDKIWSLIIWGFVLFRIFDVIKLPIARQIDQKMHNAWGVLLDDIVSAVYVAAVMYLITWLGPIRIGQFVIPPP